MLAEKRMRSGNLVKSDRGLSNPLPGLMPAGAVGGMRRIEQNDEAQLAPSEAALMSNAGNDRRRASGCARALARELLTSLGRPNAEILRRPDGAPVWPLGVVGSLAHDNTVAAAVIASSAEFGGIGIDVEPAEALEEETIAVIASPLERQRFGRRPTDPKVLFSIKEAVFKAVHPADRIFLEFDQVIVDRATMTAKTCYGRLVHWRAAEWPRIVAIAWW